MSSRKFLKSLPYIKCDLEYGVPVVAILGTIFSLWSADFFLLSLREIFSFGNGADDFFAIYSFDNTFSILSILTACLLYCGFKYDNAQYIQNWYYYKLIECSLVFIGCIVFCTSTTIRYNWPYLIIGPLILACGYYLILNVKRESKEIINSLKNEEDSDNQKTAKEDQLESVYDAETSAHFDSIIRHWGYVKFFEAIVICPSLLLVVVQKYGDAYNYSFIVFAVIGICLLILINIMLYLGNFLKCFTQKNTNNQHKDTTIEKS